jgi:2'-hydroxyisoflavone reductase
MTTGNDVRTLFNQTRRQFVQSAIAAGVGLAAMPQLGFSAVTRGAPKKILILGGTGFLGPACVDAALARGHTLTLFNRGVTEKRKGGMYPDLEKLLGDRDPRKGEGLKALEGRKWDAVIDTSAYVPRIAKASAELLAPNVGHYTMISTISVY